MPKFNHKSLSENNVVKLYQYLNEWSDAFEIIVVDDGSLLEERLNLETLPPKTRVIQLAQNTGKGAAIKQGMLEALGEICVFTDIDLPYDLSAIQFAYHLIKDKGLHFVAGDRSLAQSHFVAHAPLYRRIASRIFSKLITLFIIGGIFDSQCGFKAFSAPLAKALFPLLTIKRFSFDVEIYYLMLKYNILIRRIPVRLMNSEMSTINIVKHSFPMAMEVMRIPFNWYTGKYASSQMLTFLDPPYWEKLTHHKIS